MELNAILHSISEDTALSINSKLKELKKSEIRGRKFRVVASTEDSDRSGEIIKADGWDYKNFMNNPVIIANHVYKIENIVGKATDIYVKDNQLIIEGVFSESNPLGKLLADLYEEGMVKTVSVGFIPKERDGKTITRAELLELSFVAVPCNPNALSLDQKQLLEENGLIEIDNETKILDTLADIKQLLQLLVDGNTKKVTEANIVAKETLQDVARTVNQGLSAFKQAIKS